ncbi:MAG TPA: SRPBCC family protein, partial [Parasegetibacter sp.]
MKKFFKIVGLILLILVVFVLISAIFIPKDLHVERNITIDAPREKVWDHVNTLQGLESWSPFSAHDPNIKNTFEGEPGAIGSVHKWESKEVGTGTQTLSHIDPLNRVETDLHFIKPMEANATSFIQLGDEANSTKVTWGYDTRYNYPLNFMLLIFNMDKLMGKEFESGLSRLKSKVESIPTYEGEPITNESSG